MGAIGSKNTLEELKSDSPRSNNSTPSRVLPFDPRSPSGNVSRTPIAVVSTPNAAKNETPKARPTKSLLLDPRSPSQEAPRTPIQVEENGMTQKYQPLKASKLAQAIPLLPDECKTAQVAKDPRSPTDQVPRTPLQENIDLDSLSLRESGKENNEESGVSQEDSLQGKEVNERVEFTSETLQETERRPLTCVHNQNSDEPRAKLQAKQSRSLEEEFTKNEKNILNKLEVSVEEKVSANETLQTTTDFVQDI